jgi:FKBP-type peptidyl-prolyl cis-trans isomerase
MHKSLTILAVTVLFIICGCSQADKGFRQHPSGLSYKFFETNARGENPQPGDIIVLALKIKTRENLLIDESNFYRLQLGNPLYRGDFFTGLALLQVGDSACLKLDASGFFEKTRKGTLPVEFQQGDPVYVYLRLKNIVTSSELEEERAGLYHTDREQEMGLLKDYIELTNVTVKPKPSGLYYIEKKKGTGRKAEPGNKLMVHYTGTTIDGKMFDTSLTRGRPLTFLLGQGQVIKGWEEGFSYMNEGGVARFIIPSDLAYGKDGFSTIILPWSTLVFDVELLKVE